MRYAPDAELRQLARLAWRNLLRNPRRTGATMLAIVTGVASIMLAAGFVEDLFHQLGEALIHSQTGHLQIAREGYFTSGSRSPERYLMRNTRAERFALETLPEVADVMARVRFPALVGNGRSDLAVLAEGVEPDREARLATYVTMMSGRALRDDDRYGIALGVGVAKALRLAPGDAVTLVVSTAGGALNTLDFEVVGTFRTFSREFDARYVRVPLAAAQELLDAQGVNLLVVALKETRDTDRVAAAAGRMFAGQAVEVRTWRTLNEFYDKTVALYRRQLGVLRIVILVMVGLGVVNLVNMAVLERVGEFGTMRALGTRDRQVFMLVLAENLMLALLGATLGLAAGALLAAGISGIGIPMPPPPNADVGYNARIRLTASVLGTGFGVGFAATMLAAVLPAWRVCRMRIADQLRHSV
jgi:putative ABC transport system permease protein